MLYNQQVLNGIPVPIERAYFSIHLCIYALKTGELRKSPFAYQLFVKFMTPYRNFYVTEQLIMNRRFDQLHQLILISVH